MNTQLCRHPLVSEFVMFHIFTCVTISTHRKWKDLLVKLSKRVDILEKHDDQLLQLQKNSREAAVAPLASGEYVNYLLKKSNLSKAFFTFMGG
jgi:hypothetical protein